MMKKTLTVVAILASTTAFAADKKKKPSGESAGDRVGNRADEIGEDLASYKSGGYGMAGCGLGSLVIKDNGFVQIFAATTNGTSSNQTFAITSGTSNCTGRAKKVAAIEQKVFVENNYAQLSVDAARGDGTHLRAFAELLGCEGEEFVKLSHAKRSEIYAEPKSDQVLNVYRANLGGRCKRLG